MQRHQGISENYTPAEKSRQIGDSFTNQHLAQDTSHGMPNVGARPRSSIVIIVKYKYSKAER
jgi:hypothetical protein